MIWELFLHLVKKVTDGDHCWDKRDETKEAKFDHFGGLVRLQHYNG